MQQTLDMEDAPAPKQVHPAILRAGKRRKKKDEDEEDGHRILAMEGEQACPECGTANHRYTGVSGIGREYRIWAECQGCGNRWSYAGRERG